MEPAGAAFPGKNGKILYSEAFDSSFPQDIISVNPDGSGHTRLTFLGSGNFFGWPGDSDPEGSPDGKKVAFSRHVADGNTGEEVRDIHVMNSDGTGLERVTDDPYGEGELAWSPDGKQMAFTSNRNATSDESNRSDVYVTNSDGSGEVRRITDRPGDEGGLAWSPDGSELLYSSSADTSAFPNPGRDSEIYAMRPDGSGVRRLTDNTAHDSSPDWAPDGTEVVFSSNRDGKSAIYTMNPDGSEQERIPYELRCVDNPDLGDFCRGESEPVWSPDGTKIAFLQFNRVGEPFFVNFARLHTMNVDGSEMSGTSSSIFEARTGIDWQPLPGASVTCTIRGTMGDDFLKGTSANDVICGKGGNDTLIDHKGGDDTLFGNGGKDVLLDVKGKGILKGGDANDVLFALDGAPLDTMNGQAGKDWCVGDKGDVRTNCERGGLLSLSEEERKRLGAAKRAAGL